MERVNELRSPIYLCLGDSEVGKSQLLSLLGCRTVTEKNKERFSVNIGFYFLHKFDIERIMQDYTIEDNSLHPGITLIEMPSSTTHTNRVRLLEMADFAILVISHLSSFASEMIELLCKSTTPFVTVLNKVDTMNQQQIEEVHEKLKELAPTQKIFNVSALKGEGEDMLQLLRVFVSQTFDKQYIGNKPKCTVVDVTEGLGHGALLLVVVVDGVLNAKDTIVVSSYEGPIVSSIKALWVPRGSKELLAEGPYDREKEIRAGRAVLVALKDKRAGSVLDLSLRVLGPADDIEKLKTIAKCEAVTAMFEMHRKYGVPLLL